MFASTVPTTSACCLNKQLAPEICDISKPADPAADITAHCYSRMSNGFVLSRWVL